MRKNNSLVGISGTMIKSFDTLSIEDINTLKEIVLNMLSYINKIPNLFNEHKVKAIMGKDNDDNDLETNVFYYEIAIEHYDDNTTTLRDKYIIIPRIEEPIDKFIKERQNDNTEYIIRRK